MSPPERKKRKSLPEEEFRSSPEKKVGEEPFDERLEIVSLQDIPLEERRREANKPLYLIRYE